jgi:hypothetical protein
MANQTAGVKALLKELQAGKKQLKSDYERSLKALDEAIRVLESAKLDAMETVKSTAAKRKPGRPGKAAVSVKAIVKKSRGKIQRGRPVGAKAAFKGNLTQSIYDVVVNKKRFVHNRDIADVLTKKVPHSDRADFSKKLSVLLASLKRQGRLVTVNEGGYRKSMYWGLPDWVNADGRIMRGKENK